MWKAIRRGSAEEEVRKHRDRVTGAWKQISKQRQRVDVSCDRIMVTTLRHGTWMEKESFKKTCIKEKEKNGGIHKPFYGEWSGGLYGETGRRKVYAGGVFEWQKNPMEAKETLGNGGGREYANSQFK